jgi:hypothetical protein
MPWLQSLRDTSLVAIRNLDQLVDRASVVFEVKAMPVLQDVAARVDGMVDGTGEKLERGLRRVAADLDDRYQRFKSGVAARRSDAPGTPGSKK